MSDIPLHSILKSKAGYTPLNGDSDMPTNVSASVASAAARRNKGKRRERYVDEDDEEGAALLGGGEQDGHYDEEFRAQGPRAPSRPASVASKKKASHDKTRIVPFRPPEKLQSRFPPNIVRNQKYNAFTFLPIVFYEQFKFFFNLYFLLVALSQFIPALKIGVCTCSCLSALTNRLYRFHCNIHCSTGVCAVCDDGQGGI